MKPCAHSLTLQQSVSKCAEIDLKELASCTDYGINNVWSFKPMKEERDVNVAEILTKNTGRTSGLKHECVRPSNNKPEI